MDNIKLKIVYKLGNETNNTAEQKLTNTFEIDMKAKYDNGVDIAKWEPGKKYIYNVTVGLDKIIFEPVVAEWQTETYSPAI